VKEVRKVKRKMDERVWRFKDLLTEETFEISAKTRKGAEGIVKRNLGTYYNSSYISQGIEIKKE
jgi:predicted RNA-binding protein with PUA domain